MPATLPGQYSVQPATLADAETGEAARRVVHELLAATFGGQYGFVERSFEEWTEAHEQWSAFDWSQLTVLELDGRPVAFRETTTEFAEQRCGYISRLGVLESARGRGLAGFLLRDAFAQDAAAGLTGTLLDVDTNNPTPALALYTSAGMRADVVWDSWVRSLETDGA